MSHSIIRDKIVRVTREKRQYRLFFSIGLSISLSMVLLAFEWESPITQELVDLGALEGQFEPLMDITITEQPPPAPPKPLMIEEIVLVEEVVEVEQELEIDLEQEIEETVIEALVDRDAPADEISDEIFEVVEQQAEPSGGLDQFYRYVAKNLVYPKPAMKAKVEGKVYLQFVVDTEGNISQVTAIKGLGYGCDEEAIRIIQESPKWRPAKQRGKPVRSQIILPLWFRLS